MSLTIQCELNKEKGEWNVILDGEVDIASAAKLRSALVESYQNHPANICVDALKLKYIDSTGLGIIIGAFGRMQPNKHGINIVNAQENVMKLLKITSLDQIFCSEQL